MAEYAVAAMILLARNFHRMFRNQLGAKWDRTVPQGEIHGKALGILGLGTIGLEIARKAHVFGMRVLGVRKSEAPVEGIEKVYGTSGMAEVFEKSDYLINLLPLTAETRGIIDKSFFARMKQDAFFINLGRGGTVRQEDLIDVLVSGRIAGLVADIYEEEPLPPDSRLWSLENVILTPHISGVSPAYIDRAMEIITHNLRIYNGQRGEMINRMREDAEY
jgi:phosphoglycerate dehydrogenase-like enzyme